MIAIRRQFRSEVAGSVELTMTGNAYTRGSEPEHSPLFASEGIKLDGLPLPRPPTPPHVTTFLVGPRCKIKACVFPESELAEGRCHFHDLEEREPALFESVQPILQVLAQAKFGLAE